MRRLSVCAVTAVAGLALVSCSSAQRQPDPGDFIGTTTTPAIPAEGPVASAAGNVGRAQPSSSAADVNQKLRALARPDDETPDPRLGPGDLIEISVFEVPELSQIKVRIPNSGQVTLPLVGSFPASGATALELQSQISNHLKTKFMHDPQVSVFVHEHKSQRVSVIGAVKQGGVFPMSGEVRLADALGLAGGITEDAGSVVYVVRRVAANSATGSKGAEVEQGMTVIDLATLASGRQELNLPLQAGDVVEVPRAGTFYVGGEVQKPGPFPLKGRTTLDQAAMAAGGVSPAADWDDVRLYRSRPDGTKEVTKYSMNDFENGQSGPDLQANDVVIVGKSAGKAVLYGVRDFFKFGIGMSLPR